LEYGGAGHQRQSGLWITFSVALQALRDQERPHPLFEPILRLAGHCRFGSRFGGRQAVESGSGFDREG
jgi:hypothetical protein